MDEIVNENTVARGNVATNETEAINENEIANEETICDGIIIDKALCAEIGRAAIRHARDKMWASGLKAKLKMPTKGKTGAAVREAIQAGTRVANLTLKGTIVSGQEIGQSVEVDVKVNFDRIVQDRRFLIADNFSVELLDRIPSTIEFRHVSNPKEEAGLMRAKSIIKGNMATIVAHTLGRSLERSTEKKVRSGDILYIARVTGGYLPKMATTLPKGYGLEFLKAYMMA